MQLRAAVVVAVVFTLVCTSLWWW